MKRVLIVHHTQSGNTRRLTTAVEAGVAEEAQVEARSLRAPDAGLEDLLWCNGLLLGTPENFGALSGMMKDFLDRTYDAARGSVDGLPYAMYVSAGNDGTGAVRQLERIALGYPWKKIAEPVIARGAITQAELDACHDLGHAMAAGLAFGIF